MNKIMSWFKDHWHKPLFKIFIIFALTVIYLDIFHNQDFVEFIRFILLGACKDLITNLVHNNAVVSALAAAIIAALGALFKK